MASRKRSTAKHREAASREVAITIAKALSHPMRVRILTVLNDRMASPNELRKELDEGLSQVSYHVKVLNDFALIELVKTEPRRGAVAHYYRATHRAFMPSSITKKFPKSGRRSMIVETIEDANMDVAASLDSGKFDARDDYHVSYTPGNLDAKACRAAEKLADKYVEDFLQLGAESAERVANGESEGPLIPTSVSILVFGSERAEKEKPPSKKPRRAARKKAKKAP
jgi:DNA-binding transcriptional ArsR family regulator